MIHTLQSPLEMRQVLEMSRDVIGAPIEVLEKKILNGMSHPDSKILIESEKDGEMRGFIFATIEELDGEKAVFIHLCVVKKQANALDRKLLSHELLARIEEWGKGLGFKKMYFMTKRSPEAWERSFKFKKSYFLLEKGIS